MTRLRALRASLLRIVMLAVMIVLGLGTTARADATPTLEAKAGDDAADAPHDVPLLGPAADIKLPPLPSAYVTRDLGWLKMSFPASAKDRVDSLLRDADGIKAQLIDALGERVLDRVEVRIAPTFADMTRLAPIGAPPPGYASGVAYPRLGLVLLTMLPPHGSEAVDLDEVFRHELAHVALEDAVRGQHVPVWFNEGLAIALSGELAIARRHTLWNATLSGTVLPLSDLDRSFPSDHFDVSIAYAESADFMQFLMRRADRNRFIAMIGRVREGQPFERAIAEAYGSDLRKLEFQWRTDLDHRYSVIPVLTGGGIIWVAVIGGLAVAYVRKRRRAKTILAKWAHEEALEDALRAEALRAAAEARTDDVLAVRGFAPARKVQSEGRWHTLH